MADNKKKLILHDESLNSFGFWVLTSGIDMTRFAKNPVMLYNHHRTMVGKTDEILPIGRWENLSIDDKGIITAEPVFDMNDEFAAKIASKVENGFMSGCSIGIRIIEISEDPQYLKEGQTRPTVIKCELREVSIVDIPSNPDAAGIVLYDNDDNVITLSDGADGPLRLINNKPIKNMKEIALKLGLAETATEQDVLAKLDAGNQELAALKAERDQALAELKAFKDSAAEARKKEATDLIDAALKDGRIEASQKETFEKLFAADYDSAKAALAGIPARKSLRDRTGAGNGSSTYESMSWDDIDKAGKLQDLKDNYPELYEKKFKEMSAGLHLA